MIRPTKVNCCGHRHTQRAKDAVRLWPKLAKQSVVPSHAWNKRTFQTKAGINLFVSLETNIVKALRRIETTMQRMELSFLAALSSSERKLISEGQAVISEVTMNEAKTQSE